MSIWKKLDGFVSRRTRGCYGIKESGGACGTF